MKVSPWVFATLLATSAAAAPPEADPAAHTVVVPYDAARPLAGQTPQQYYLGYEDFQRLWSSAKENRRPPAAPEDKAPPEAALGSAHHRLELAADGVSWSAEMQAGSRGAWAELEVAPKWKTGGLAPVALPIEISADGVPTPVQEGSIRLEKPGNHALTARGWMPRPPGWTKLELQLPRSAARLLEVRVPPGEGQPTVESGRWIASRTEPGAGGARVHVYLLKTEAVVSLRRALAGRFVADGPVATAAWRGSLMRYEASPAAFDATLELEFPGVTRNQVSFSLDSDWVLDGLELQAAPGGSAPDRLTRVTPQTESGLTRYQVQWAGETAQAVQLHLRGHRIGSDAAASTTPRFSAEARRLSTEWTLLAEAALDIEPQPDAAWQQLPERSGSEKTDLRAVGRFSATGAATLAYQVAPARQRSSATADYLIQLSPNRCEVTAALTLVHFRDPWHHLSVGLPPGFEVVEVRGSSVRDWHRDGDQLRVDFDRPDPMARLVLQLLSNTPDAANGWTLRALGLQGFEKYRTRVDLATHAAMNLTLQLPAAERAIIEEPPEASRSQLKVKSPLMVRRSLRSEEEAWAFTAALVEQAPRFSVDATLLAQATAAGLRLSQHLAVKVEQGAVPQLEFRLPASLPEGAISGEALRDHSSRVEGDQRIYQCVFQSGILDATTMSLEIVLPPQGEISLPFVEVPGSVGLRRFFLLDNASQREMRVAETTGVEVASAKAPPYVPATLSAPRYYAGRGAQNGVLRVAFEELDATAGTRAVVTLAAITTLWRADGERWDTIQYTLFNRALQFLPVHLPAEAELIAVTVNDQPVRADEETREDQRIYLIPLIQTAVGATSSQVTLITRRAAPSGGLPTHLEMKDPELPGLTVERTVWTTWLPPGYRVKKQDGNLEEIAEESREAEEAQTLLADLARFNRELQGNAYENRADAQQAMKRAEQIEQKLTETANKIAQGNQSKLQFLNRAGVADLADQIALNGKANYDLGNLRQEIHAQSQALDDNKTQQNSRIQKAAPMKGAQAKSFKWLFNNPPETDSTTGLDRSPSPSQIDLGESVQIASDFLREPPDAPSARIPGLERRAEQSRGLRMGRAAIVSDSIDGLVMTGGATWSASAAPASAGDPFSAPTPVLPPPDAKKSEIAVRELPRRIQTSDDEAKPPSEPVTRAG
ncbi:MAG: hypothetical protein KDK99_07190, partial [Verrucomicrobiales bacterium]|nr:hypothetical protein [Verrucomicrobiales bacterium]